MKFITDLFIYLIVSFLKAQLFYLTYSFIRGPMLPFKFIMVFSDTYRIKHLIEWMLPFKFIIVSSGTYRIKHLSLVSDVFRLKHLIKIFDVRRIFPKHYSLELTETELREQLNCLLRGLWMMYFCKKQKPDL